MEFAGAIYHAMCRGDRRENIFEDDTDRARFPETLAEACQRTGWRIRLFMARPVVQSNEALTFQRRSDLICLQPKRAGAGGIDPPRASPAGSGAGERPNQLVARAERAFARVARKMRAESRRAGLPLVVFPNGKPASKKTQISSR